MKAIPVFKGKENCTYTVRVPRSFVGSSESPKEKEYFQEICRRRNLWGTEVYTDDSDVVAAAVHSGWIQGDFGDFNEDLREVDRDEQPEADAGDNESLPSSLAEKPTRPVKVPPDHDMHVTVLILPPLQAYGSTTQNHVWSRAWGQMHDGMSYMIQRIDFVDESEANRTSERDAKAKKQRLAAEEKKRREAAAGLLMFASASEVQSGGGIVRVGA